MFGEWLGRTGPRSGRRCKDLAFLAGVIGGDWR